MSEEWLSKLRLGARGSACLAVTLGLWACLDAETELRRRRGEGASGEQALLHKWVVRWARQLLRILRVELRTRGPHLDAGLPYPALGAGGRGRVFVMNHRSALDILVTFAHLEARLVSRHDLADWPLLGQGARRLGTLFLDRSSSRSGAAVLKTMTRALKQGQAIAIYPEGTAFAGDEVRPFHPGAFHVARRLGAELVPLGIAYADEAAYYGDEDFGAHVGRLLSLPRLRVALVAGVPIATTATSDDELSESCRRRVQELVLQARAQL